MNRSNDDNYAKIGQCSAKVGPSARIAEYRMRNVVIISTYIYQLRLY